MILLLRYVKQRGTEKLKFHDNLNIKLLVSTVFIFLSYDLICANSLDLLLNKIPVDDYTIRNIIALVAGLIVLALAAFIFAKNTNRTSKTGKAHIQI